MWAKNSFISSDLEETQKLNQLGYRPLGKMYFVSSNFDEVWQYSELHNYAI